MKYNSWFGEAPPQAKRHSFTQAAADAKALCAKKKVKEYDNFQEFL